MAHVIVAGPLEAIRTSPLPHARCARSRIATGKLEREFLAFVDGLAPKEEYLALFEQVVLEVVEESPRRWRRRTPTRAAGGGSTTTAELEPTKLR